MKNKYVSFAKNIGITAAAMFGVGAITAELSDLLTHNDNTTSIVSTVSEYITAYGVFLPLHAKDNKDLYIDQYEQFRWRGFIIDQVKLTGALFVLDLAYLVGKPLLTRKFLQMGNDSSIASMYADIILYPVLAACAIPLGKISGNIRNKE